MRFNDEIAEKLKKLGLVGMPPGLQQAEAEPSYVLADGPEAPNVALVPPAVDNTQNALKILNDQPSSVKSEVETFHSRSGPSLGDISALVEKYSNQGNERSKALNLERAAVRERGEKLYAEAKTDPKMSKEQSIGSLILTALPTLMGGLIGGKSGIAVGGQVGAAAGTTQLAGIEKQNAERKKSLLAEAERSTDQEKELLRQETDLSQDGDKRAFELEKLAIELPGKEEDRRMVAENRRSLAEMRRDQMDNRNDTRRQAVDDKFQKTNDQNVQLLSKRLDSVIALNNVFKEIEETVGFNVDDYDEKTETAPQMDPKTGIKSSKPVDAPGFNLGGLGPRISFTTDQGRLLRNRIQNLTNATMKAYSGAVITDAEAARLLGQLGQSNLNTEKDMIRGLRNAKRELRAMMNSRRAGFPDSVVKEYDRNLFREMGAPPSATADSPPADSTDAQFENMSDEDLEKMANQ